MLYILVDYCNISLMPYDCVKFKIGWKFEKSQKIECLNILELFKPTPILTAYLYKCTCLMKKIRAHEKIIPMIGLKILSYIFDVLNVAS